MRWQSALPLILPGLLLLGACSSHNCTPRLEGDSMERTSRQQIPRQQIEPRVQSIPQSMPRY